MPRIGLLIDRLDPSLEYKLINAAQGTSSITGANVVALEICKEKVEANISRSRLGHYVGEVMNAEVLVEGAMRLFESGVNCIAVVTDIGGLTESAWAAHYGGDGINPIGAIEALISRAIRSGRSPSWSTSASRFS
jgi:hypothetical protein